MVLVALVSGIPRSRSLSILPVSLHDLHAVVYYNISFGHGKRREDYSIHNKLNLHQTSGALDDRVENRPTVHA